MTQQLTMLSTILRRAYSTARHGWRRYSHLMDTHGWRAQAVNTGVLMATGDVLAQLLIERRRLGKDYDPLRTLRFGAGGLFVFGPTMHVWYSALDRFVVRAKTPLRLAVYKMLCDQLGFLPVYLVSYISFFSVLEGNNLPKTKNRVETMFGRLLMFSYQIWPAVQIANFYFVPLHHRIFVINAVGLIYYTYIDWSIEQQNHADKKTVYCLAGEEATTEEDTTTEEEDISQDK